MRRKAREVVYKMLYSEIYTEKNEELFEELIKEEKLSEDAKIFAKTLLEKVEEHKSEWDEVIESLAHNYKLDRVYPTDKCALYMGFTEIKFFDDVPYIVAIDEAVSLCKKYSTKESLSFVNGILAEFVKINKIA